MAGTDRTQNHPLSRALREHGERFSFFQAVRLLQSLHPEAVPVGHQGPPQREVVRFRPPLDLSFAPSDVAAVRASDDGEAYEIECRFLALYGTVSPLPACYTEELLYDDPEGLLRDFLDLFNHRLISLFYRAFEKYRHSIQFDVAADDPITRRLRILAHAQRPGEQLRLLAFLGLLLQQPLSEASLEHVLAACLEVPVQVHSCRVRWVDVPAHQRTELGRRNCALGGQTPLGSSIRDASSTFGIVVGPLDYDSYLEMLPAGPGNARLRELVDRLNPEELDYEVELFLEPGAGAPARLGTSGGGLGWTTWLGQPATSVERSSPDLTLLYTEPMTAEVA